MDDPSVLDWLLEGDPSIRWQVMRDLTGAKPQVWKTERKRVATEGWGRRLLDERAPDGHWGGGIYNPKWISTTYTLLLLRRMGLPPDTQEVRESCEALLDLGRAPDGGINFWQKRTAHSETCVTGIVLSILGHFGVDTDYQDTVVEHLFREQMDDGGWNCQYRAGATHASFNTTDSVLEGLREYVVGGGALSTEAEKAEERAREFFLRHRLYRSHRTGNVVRSSFSLFSFPPRWYHDVLRTLDYFAAADAPWDERLEDPIGVVNKRRKKDGRWVLQNRHGGKVFFEMEEIGEPSRWNTLRCLRVLQWWNRQGGKPDA
jgi:hypothetical protein